MYDFSSRIARKILFGFKMITNKNRERLFEIERNLYWGGCAGRKELIEKFGISAQQGTKDLKSYLAMNGEHVKFDHSQKSYLPTEDFKPILIKENISDFIEWGKDSTHMLELMTMPNRSTPIAVLRKVSQAIKNKQSVEIEYNSFSNPQGTRRRITPHSLVFTHLRYHVRAYCHRNNDYRDFVIGRIKDIGEFGEPALFKENDDHWNTLVFVKLGPHPKLVAAAKQLVEDDFCMENGEVQIPVKLALLGYFCKQFNLDKPVADSKPEEQQIVLLNPDMLSLV